jgi:hypothetical protein
MTLNGTHGVNATIWRCNGQYWVSIFRGLLNQNLHEETTTINGDCRILHNLYSSCNIIRMIKSSMRWSGHVARTELENVKGKLLGRPICGRCKVQHDYVDWIEVTQNTVQCRHSHVSQLFNDVMSTV